MILTESIINLYTQSAQLVIIAILIGVLGFVLNSRLLVAVALIKLIALIGFYRVPVIKTKIFKPNAIYSPAFGTLKRIIQTPTHIHFITFLSPLDIHIQYYPMNGVVDNIIHDDTGRFALAFQLNKSDDNEKTITTLKTNYGNVIITQIAGKLVRRISVDCEDGDTVSVGERLGMIKFGSRVDLIIPRKGFVTSVKPNERLNGPDTMLGYYAS